jgi:pyridoxal phosphate enzyme (YggS family)
LAFFINIHRLAFLKASYQNLKQTLSDKDVTLIAVSKTKPVLDILAAYDQGQRDFGENYVQEFIEKQPQLPADIRWHFIGHLQTNKVKYIAPFVHLIHGVDSERLLIEINKQGEKQKRRIACLLQVHISNEETKFGLDTFELMNIVQEHLLSTSPALLPWIEVQGLMGMASFSKDEALVRSEFNQLKNQFDQISALQNLQTPLKTLSMGMSGDYPLALSCGSNMIRVGSLIFGERTYP